MNVDYILLQLISVVSVAHDPAHIASIVLLNFASLLQEADERHKMLPLMPVLVEVLGRPVARCEQDEPIHH